MFIEQGIKPENKFWKYLAGSVLIILASAIGNLPLILPVVIKMLVNGENMEELGAKVMTTFDPNLTFFLLFTSFVFAMAGIFWVVKNIHHQTMLQIMTSRKKLDWQRILFSFAIWGAFIAVTTAFLYYENPGDYLINFKPIPFFILLAVATIMIPIQTSTEELVFRGYLMQGFGNLAMNKWFPLLMTSVIFGTMHILNPEVTKIGLIALVYYIGTGLFLGIITLMDEGIELSMGFHAANNLVGALLVTSDWTAFQTESVLKDIGKPSVGYDILFPIVIIFPILLFIFSKKYNWTDWKGKLTGTIEIPPNGISQPTNDQLINEITENNDSAYRNTNVS